MAKLTLIDMVQDILSDMNSDEVNSINDTIEATQIAQIVKSVFFEMIANKNWPHLRELVNLEASGDNTKPTHMKLPELVKELDWVNYNKRKSGDTFDKYSEVEYKNPDEFLAITNAYKTNQADVTQVTDFSGVKFNIKTDVAPSIWTSFDDEYLIFNSHDSAVDTTLQSDKTQAQGYVEPGWTMSDTFTPDLPAEAFPALLAEAKSACFLRLKQQADQKSEQQSLRQRNWLSRKAFRAAGGIRFPDYGRKNLK